MEPRDLPSVDALANQLVSGLPRSLVVDVARRSIERARDAINSGGSADIHSIARDEIDRLAGLRAQSIINATGVLLNTNLGRAPLHPAAAAAAEEAHRRYGNVEFLLDAGRRGGRGHYVAELVRSLTHGEDALVVNNNAGGLYLTLTALANELQVIVSRGELIEIGGSFRLPELMGAAGAWLMEVGTTNRTRLADYEDAIGAETSLILKVHPSNYRVEGFTEEAGYGNLADLAHKHHLPFVADIGSGLLDAGLPWLDGPPPPWLAGEPAAVQTISAGADLVLFSGDKLLGGPQAGIIAGRGELVARLRSHPVARALRCDGPTLAALAATLELYADGNGAEVPFWSMAGLSPQTLRERSRALIAAAGIEADVIESDSVVGAGSVPGQTIPSPVIAVAGNGDDVWTALLAADPPVLARRVEGRVIIDLRAVDAGQDQDVVAALEVACRS
jgi:L-seryl-tRNA(Ser) seleniumtransferase